MFDVLRYLRDINRQFWTEGKNVSVGWINIQCPFCGDSSNHGGFAPPDHKGAPYHCRRCQRHSLEDVVMALERIGYREAWKRVREYQTDSRPPSVGIVHKKAPGKLKLPIGTGPMNEYHKRYLRQRRFDPDLMESKYGLLGTGPAGSSPHRIVIPIFSQGRMVSWQARDITGRAELRYDSPRPEETEIGIKRLLYNLDNCRGRSVIVVEGITDCWRFGDDCCATFGTTVTAAQIRQLGTFSHISLVFDSEPHTLLQAQKLCNTLASLGIAVDNVSLSDGDPGEMDQTEADNLKKELLEG